MSDGVKRVVLVGHCGADSFALRRAIAEAVPEVEIVAAESKEKLATVARGGVALVLVNRTLDYGFGFSDGVDLIEATRVDFPELKMMLVSNYEDAQASAVQAGALPGFGKSELRGPRVKKLLAGVFA